MTIGIRATSSGMMELQSTIDAFTASFNAQFEEIKRLWSIKEKDTICSKPGESKEKGVLKHSPVLDLEQIEPDLEQKENITTVDVSASNLIRKVTTECGVEFDDDPEVVVIDHTNYAVSETEGDHTLIARDKFIQSDVILGSKKIEAPIFFQGMGHSSNPSNGLVFQVLSATPSAYFANPKSKLSNPLALTGSVISLVSVVQARNNAQSLISGSLRMFSNGLVTGKFDGIKALQEQYGIAAKDSITTKEKIELWKFFGVVEAMYQNYEAGVMLLFIDDCDVSPTMHWVVITIFFFPIVFDPGGGVGRRLMTLQSLRTRIFEGEGNVMNRYKGRLGHLHLWLD